MSDTKALNLDGYALSQGARKILQEAAKIPSHDGQAITTSLVLLAMVESGRPTGDANWVGDFMRQAAPKSQGETFETYLRQRGIFQRGQGVATHMSSGLKAALAVAKDIAERTTGSEKIAGRHLLGALITSVSPVGAQERLADLEIDLPLLRERFYKWVRGYGDKDTAWRDLLVGSGDLPPRLSNIDADDTRGPDLLGIEQDVVALATIIAARAVSPPLSIGLFGNWGSGKTFFMRQLRRTVAELSKDAREKKEMQRVLPFYKRIVQIEFNAWHYVEGNLWASLVEHIFDNLHLSDNNKKTLVQKMQEHWIAKLEFADVARKEATQKADAAQQRVDAAEQAVTTLRRDHEQKKEELQRLSAKRVARDFTLTHAHAIILECLQPLGLRPAGAAVNELQSSLREARTMVEKGNTALTPLLHAQDRHRRLVSLAIILIGGPVVGIVVSALVTSLGAGQIATISGLMAAAASFLTSGAAWIRKQAAWMSERLKNIEEANSIYDKDLAEAQAQTTAEIAETEQDLALARQNLAAANQLVEDARREHRSADEGLKQATAARLLGNFIEDRASSSDYRKHLGVLALIRDDFEKLSDLIEEDNFYLSPEHTESDRFDKKKKFASLDQEEKEQAMRINRIVLYIDDLDRCPPNKVVDVLEAVHLLLAFPLFVVVVGVDARWISRSLETRYRELLNLGATDTAAQLDTIFGAVRSEDYLEKIFQIPLWLRRMAPGSVRKMVLGLIRPTRLHAHQDQQSIGQVPQQPLQVQPTNPPGTTTNSLTAPAAAGGSIPSGSTAAPGSPHAPLPNIRSLEIEDFEFEVIEDLAPLLGRSPRALKRFVNVYRLIKAGLSPAEHTVFVRQPKEGLGDFAVVLLLLAIDTGLPRISRAVFDAIRQSEAAKTPTLLADLDRAGGNQADWNSLKSWLQECDKGTSIAEDLPKLMRWIPTVARYSFQSAQLDPQNHIFLAADLNG